MVISFPFIPGKGLALDKNDLVNPVPRLLSFLVQVPAQARSLANPCKGEMMDLALCLSLVMCVCVCVFLRMCFRAFV